MEDVMIGAGDLKKGITIELDGQLYTVLDYQHIKMGRGTAQLRLKLRDVKAGHTIERTFQASDKFNQVRIERHSAQHLYKDDDLYYFMDTETYEQTPLNSTQLGDALKYLKEGLVVDLLTYADDPIGVELPNSVELEVVETGPCFRGDTAQAGTKPATLETGIIVQVPLFVNSSDVVRVDTRTGQYLERVT